MREGSVIKHPMSKLFCETKLLDVGDVIESGDMYRSLTITDKKGIPKWIFAGDSLANSVVSSTCDVQFVRFVPMFEQPKEVEIDN